MFKTIIDSFKGFTEGFKEGYNEEVHGIDPNKKTFDKMEVQRLVKTDSDFDAIREALFDLKVELEEVMQLEDEFLKIEQIIALKEEIQIIRNEAVWYKQLQKDEINLKLSVLEQKINRG